MQIGTRWPVGGEPPQGVPAGMRAAIDDEERTLAELGADTSSWRWTLTWLEGDPVVVIHPDDAARAGVTREA